MALSPNIPTSFVPKQQIVQAPRHRSSGENVLMFASLVVLVIGLLGAGGVFGYDHYLKTVAADKAVQVDAVQKSISAESIEEYVRSRDRFSESKSILNQHVATSQFLELLEKLTLQNVYFDTLKFSLSPDRSAKVILTGTARNFNALAAQSSAFSAERSNLKETVFSDITTSKSGFVSFTMTTSIDADLLAMSTQEENIPQQAAPQATTTPQLPATTGTTTTATSSVKTTTP